MAGPETEPEPNDATVPIVDTHHHLWDLRRYRYDWLSGDGQPEVSGFLGDYAPVRQDYLIDELLADFAAVQIVKSVHVQADISETDPVVETAWLQEIADVHGFPHAIVGFADLRAPDVAVTLERHAAYPNTRGIRMPDEPGLFDSRAFRDGALALQGLGLSLQVDSTPAGFPAFAAFARSMPDLQIFLGHTGVPEERDATYFDRWRAGLQLVAEAPNVILKISGLGMGDHAWSESSIRPWILAAIEAFGPARCVVGTNWPVDRLYSDLPALTSAYRSILSDLGPAEQRAILLTNAERLYAI